MPSLNLPQKPEKTSSLERQERILKRKKLEEAKQRKEEINKLITERYTTATTSASPQPNVDESFSFSENMELNMNSGEENVNVKYKKLLENYNKLQGEMKVMKHKLHLQRKQLQYYKKDTIQGKSQQM